MTADKRPIAMLDSGVGGLSILREVRRLLPREDVLYFADQGHVPYGPRPVEEIRQFTHQITEFFLARQAKVIVIACNAASAASLYYLRNAFPDVPFVGMEPAVKPAAENTTTGVIGVITTKATFQGELFASVINRFADDKQVVTQVCPDFVTLVEAGELDTPHLKAIAREYLAPLIEAGIDQLVLGCTHFPFLTPVLQETAGESVTIVDPSPAVARQTARLIAGEVNASDRPAVTTYFTSGDAEQFHKTATHLLNNPIPRENVKQVSWQDGILHEMP